MRILNALIPLSMMLMGQAGYADTVHTAPATPEDVANLYLSTMLRRDVASADALNNYIRPTLDGKNAFDPDETAAFHARTVDVLAKAFVPAFGKQSARPLAEAIIFAGEQSVCHSTGSVTGADPNAAGETIATVHYHCQVVDLDKLAGPLWHVQAKDHDKLVAKVLLALRQARVDLPVNGQLVLRRNRAPKTGQDIWVGNLANIRIGFLGAAQRASSETVRE